MKPEKFKMNNEFFFFGCNFHFSGDLLDVGGDTNYDGAGIE